MTLNATGRKHVSELVKGYTKFESGQGVNYCFATVNCEGSGDVEPIGTLVKWSNTDSAFKPITVNPDWAASTAYAAGAVVKPATQNGLEYVCITAGTSNNTEGEPTFPTVPGATVTETDGVVWMAREPYGNDVTSPLPNHASICITVGSKEGFGFNKDDVTLSGTSVKMTVLYRGEASIVTEGVEWGAIAAADKSEISARLEKQGIRVETSATAVVPSHIA